MMHECDRIGDAIWEHVRFGTELPPDAERHIAECAECARAVNEARSLSGLVQSASSVPPSPDCAQAVMSRISSGARRPVWAYAVASVLLVVLLIGALMILRPSGEPARMVQDQPKPAPRATIVTNPAPKSESPTPAIVPECRVAVVKHPIRHRRHLAIHQPVPKQIVPRNESPTPEQVAEERRAIIAVSATWGEEPIETSSYAYTQTNEATGETTTCRVVKSPGAVSIFMESKPGGREPPSKGA